MYKIAVGHITYEAVSSPMVQALRTGMQSKSTFHIAIENLLVWILEDVEVSAQAWMEVAACRRDPQPAYEDDNFGVACY
jgi:hypothetical protein